MRKVIEFLERKSERILEENEFTKEGLPSDNCQAVIQASTSLTARFEQDQIKDALVSLDLFIPKRGLTNELIEEVHEKSQAKTYEKPVETVNIHIDKVCVKKQKEKRQVQTGGSFEVGSIKKKNKHPKVQNTVARIEHEKKGFTLTFRWYPTGVDFCPGFSAQ